MIKDKPVQSFLDELASSASTPGGGSAAAIMGAMGAALVSMVGNLTVGKKNYQEVETEMQELLQKSEQLRAQLTDMIKADVEVFDNVMAAYGMAHDAVYGTSIEQGVIMMCSKDGYYQQFMIEGEEFRDAKHQFLRRLDEFYSGMDNNSDALVSGTG